MNRVLWIVFFSLLIAVGNVQAHCGKCGMGDSAKEEMKSGLEQKLNKMTKKLKLTKEQKGQVESIMKEKMERKRQIMEKTHADMEALHSEIKAKLKAVLSAEQMQKWEAEHEGKGQMKKTCSYCKKGKMCPMCQKMHGKDSFDKEE